MSLSWVEDLVLDDPIIPAARLCGQPDHSSQMIPWFVCKYQQQNNQSQTSSHTFLASISQRHFNLSYDCPFVLILIS